MSNKKGKEPALEFYTDDNNENVFVIEHREEGAYLVTKLNVSERCKLSGHEFSLKLRDHVLHVKIH